MERLTKRKLEEVEGKQIVLCDHKEEDCNDSCMYRRCKWNEKALRKLKEYEDTGLSPEDVIRVNDFEQSQAGKLLKKLNKVEKNLLEELRKHEWIPAEHEVPVDNEYVLLSFDNFSGLLIGRYEQYEDGSGNWYLGDCDEEDTCLANDLFVSAWMPLPDPYDAK